MDRLIYRANIDNTVNFKGEELPIVEAIELSIQLRAEATLCKEMSRSEKERLYHSTGDNVIFYQVTLYDPEEYRVKVE